MCVKMAEGQNLSAPLLGSIFSFSITLNLVRMIRPIFSQPLSSGDVLQPLSRPARGRLRTEPVG